MKRKKRIKELEDKKGKKWIKSKVAGALLYRNCTNHIMCCLGIEPKKKETTKKSLGYHKGLH